MIHNLLHRRPLLTIAAATGTTLVALAFAAQPLWIAWFPPVAPQRFSMAYYYDQNTRELFEAPAELPVPFARPSGPYRGMPAAVRAVVFSCGRCSDPQQRYIGWLEAPVSVLRQAGIGVQAAAAEDQSDLAIRRTDDEGWVYPGSPAGEAILESASGCVGERNATACHPKRRLRSEVEPEYLRALDSRRD